MNRHPLDTFVDALLSRVTEDPSGAKSLASLVAVVPTAQSGRRLRQKLAARLGAVVPPAIMLPWQLVLPTDDDTVAGRTDELLAFREALGPEGSLGIAAQLSDIRGILGADALSFADVAARIGEILTDDLADVEVARWRNFSALEERYFSALAKRGKTDRIAAMKRTIADPPALSGIDAIVLVGLLDPIPAMRRVLETYRVRDGLEIVELDCGETSVQPVRNVIPCATAAAEAERIAEMFAAVKADEALPALCVADPEIFPEIQCALQAKGLRVHNPSQTPLVASSLGHLVEQAAALMRTRSYNVFSSFIRSGDVRRWLCAELKIGPAEYVAALNVLDNAQAELLPEKIDDIAPKVKGKLRAIFERVDVGLRKGDLRRILQAVFKCRLLDEHDADAREFAAAAEVINALIDECGADMELFIFRMRESAYSLEPDEGEVILTDGWLELPFLEAGELVIAGFNEGRVPESVVGHAFLPDRLRRALGLGDNESRTVRDRRILQLALACRASSAVKVLFHAIDAAGDVLKPSRLLFDGLSDCELADRAMAFYQLRAGSSEILLADLPAVGRLHLDMPPEHAQLNSISPSGIDEYLRCPFTYFLKKTFGERKNDCADELDFAEFGNLIHGALERWGTGSLKDSETVEEIAAELSLQVDALLGERFGTSVPAIVALQGESAKRRLADFATIQAAWHAEGWSPVATERKLTVRYGHTDVKGRCDRIDFNARTNQWCVIDYKTFDDLDHAVAKKGGEWKRFQLPLYCAMLDADQEFPAAKLDNIVAAYCVLGKTQETTAFSALMTGAEVPEAEEKVRAIISAIERGIFWPPASTCEWQRDFKDWIFSTPEESVDPDWRADQERRLSQH